MRKDLFANFPEALRALPQWVVWKKELRPDGKWTKVPYQINGRKAATTREEEWTTFAACMSVVDSFDGIGFVFTKGIVGIDLDHCFKEDGTLKEWAFSALVELPSYTEKSPSGDGLHIIIRSDVVPESHRKDGIECYSTGRFFTVTGEVYNGNSGLETVDYSNWYKEVFGEREDQKKSAAPIATNIPNDETILSVMFRSKNGMKMRDIFERGEWRKHGYESQSQADLALAGSLMFFCCNDKERADRLFRRSDLMRDKWDDPRGASTYGKQTLNEAVKEEVMAWKTFEGYMMSSGKNPVPLLILENICRAFDSDRVLCNRFRLNEFSYMVEARGEDGWKNLQDYDVLEAQRYLSTNFECFAKVSKEMTIDAIKCTAFKYKVNPPKDYFGRLKWDRVPRLDSWLSVVYGVENDELNRQIGSNWIKGLVKRVLDPGCQFDEVLVLESPQGYRKSTSLRILGAPWHVESTLSTEDKDFYMLLASNVIVEFSEGDIVGRTSARKLKAIITKTEDTFRPPYERGMITVKRGCVFAMTTNDDDYQKDETGGRRWLPITLTRIADVEWLMKNRDQLFAEAVHRVFTLKETTHEYPQEQLVALQESKQEPDVYDEFIEEWYRNLPPSVKKDGVTTLDAYQAVINSREGVEMSRTEVWRVSSIFRRVLKLKNRVQKVDNKTVRRYV